MSSTATSLATTWDSQQHDGDDQWIRRLDRHFWGQQHADDAAIVATNPWGGAVDFVPVGSLMAFYRKRAKIDVAGVTARPDRMIRCREIAASRDVPAI